MIKRLSELKVGDSATIQLVFGKGRMRTRMFDMGITPNAKVYFRKTAPMGDPMQISIRGYELTLRKCEAFHILVETNANTDINSEKSIKEIQKFKEENEKLHRHHHFRQEKDSCHACSKKRLNRFRRKGE